MLTKESEYDPSVPPAILVEHVQRYYIFLANLSNVIVSTIVSRPEIQSQACLVLTIPTSLGVARIFQIPSECVHEVISPRGT
jgi:hypothetical protein